MIRRFCVVSLLLTLLLPVVFAGSFTETSPERVGVSAERLERLDNTVQGYLDREEIAGAVTLIARHGKIAHFKAYGYRDLESKAPMGKDSLFRMFSMTKPVTCAALMILVEENEILLSDPVSKYLPEFADMKVLLQEKDGEITTEPVKNPITIQNLAMHTSGLAYGIPGNISPTLSKKYQEPDIFNSHNPLEKAIKLIASFPLVHQPGTTWEYGTSIDVLARVIEVVAKKPYGEFLQERLFGPLKMVDTGYVTPEKNWDRVACLYTTKDGHLQKTMAFEEYYKVGIHYGGGSGLISSAIDYARFAQMLCNDGELEGVRILSPQSVERMSTNLIREEKNNTGWHNDKAYGFGLGVRVVKDPAALDTLASIGTWGWNGMASTEFFIDPKKDFISIFMTQYIPTNNKQIWQRYTNKVYQAIME